MKNIIPTVLSSLITASIIGLINLYYLEDLTKENIELYFSHFFNHFSSYDLIFIVPIVYLFYSNYKLQKKLNSKEPKQIYSTNNIENRKLEKKAKERLAKLKKDDKVEDFKMVYSRIEGTGGQIGNHHSDYLIQLELITRFSKHSIHGSFFIPTQLGKKVFEFIID